MKVKLPGYTSKDYLVLAYTILPMTIILNSLIFSSGYFHSMVVFLFTTVVTGAAISIDFVICGGIAVFMKNRFPKESEVEWRLTMMIVFFIAMTGLFLFGLFKGYEYFPFLHYSFNDEGFAWAFIAMGIINIFFTFLHEGIARYERWKLNLHETEALKKVYRQTRLQGLKSQINPHFLFNSLNSLSSLIQENQEKGEKFLNEMSKLYRYMLQNDEETLVPLETELKFLDSYIHILRARHNDALNVKLTIRDMDKEKLLPPLTLQNIIENSVGQNAVCRDCPLEIDITSNEQYLSIRNNIIPKMAREPEENLPSLDNIVQKYQLLVQKEVLIKQDSYNRCIYIPLIERKEEVIL